VVVLVDVAADAIAAIRANAASLAREGGDVKIVRQDARTAMGAFADAQERFDVVYLDPPYDSDLYEAALERAGRTGLLAEEGVVVAEHFHKRALPERIGGLTRSREVRVGDHRLSFYRRHQQSAHPQS
jgi:16S rRNA G966 N2-methylase RsmD